MYKLAPLVAQAYAMKFASASLHSYYEHVLNNEIKKDMNFKSLDLLHHISSGFKSVYTRLAKDGMETVR